MMSMTCSKHVENYKYIEKNLCVKLGNYQESEFIKFPVIRVQARKNLIQKSRYTCDIR